MHAPSIVYIEKFHSKLVYVGLDAACTYGILAHAQLARIALRLHACAPAPWLCFSFKIYITQKCKPCMVQIISINIRSWSILLNPSPEGGWLLPLNHRVEGVSVLFPTHFPLVAKVHWKNDECGKNSSSSEKQPTQSCKHSSCTSYVILAVI